MHPCTLDTFLVLFLFISVTLFHKKQIHKIFTALQINRYIWNHIFGEFEMVTAIFLITTGIHVFVCIYIGMLSTFPVEKFKFSLWAGHSEGFGTGHISWSWLRYYMHTSFSVHIQYNMIYMFHGLISQNRKIQYKLFRNRCDLILLHITKTLNNGC